MAHTSAYTSVPVGMSRVSVIAGKYRETVLLRIRVYPYV